jgi:uncharacterized NAD(P)/FAD-binding protein YdhS
MASDTNAPETQLRVVIIGGGFSGTMTAVNLARLTRRSVHVTVVNHNRPVGRGIAYGTRRAEHLLNVAARNMSAFPDQPDHFVQWLRTRGEFDDVPDNELRERFVPRRIYGDYLRSLMHHHLQASNPTWPATVEFVVGEAIDIESVNGGSVVILRDGQRLEADRVVLAIGNEPPAELPGAERLAEHPAWIGNPWGGWEDQLPPAGGTIVLLGTGLSTVDAVISLRTRGWQGTIRAVSRHGWLPQAHFRGIEYPDFPPAGSDLATVGLDHLVRLMEDHCARLHARGANPAIIVDKMRPHTQRIWQSFSIEERRRFARDYAARWNILRHRIAPEIHAQIASAQITGQLHVHAGVIERVEPAGSRVRAVLACGTALEGDLVVNATGPQIRLSGTRSELLRTVLDRGLITADGMDMGLHVDADHVAIQSDGTRSPTVLALGPLLRGTLWETIAVPELRSQARRVAETVIGEPPASGIETVSVIEYMI